MSEALRPSSVRKRQAILDAAEQVFLRDGYLGANMDELAVLSGVSKQTVYAHFGSKEALFVDLVGSMTRAVGDELHLELAEPTNPDDLRQHLEEQAFRQLSAVMDPRILRLRRLAIAEALRFPDLGRVLWENGPQRAVVRLGAYFRTARRTRLAAHRRPRVRGHLLQLAGDGALGERGDAARRRHPTGRGGAAAALRRGRPDLPRRPHVNRAPRRCGQGARDRVPRRTATARSG